MDLIQIHLAKAREYEEKIRHAQKLALYHSERANSLSDEVAKDMYRPTLKLV